MALPIVDQVAGSLLGLALGDALGAPVEACPPEDARRYVNEVLRHRRHPTRGKEGHPFGQVTDDTQLTRELLQSIADIGDFDPVVFAKRLLDFVASGRLVGGGPASNLAARQLALGRPWHDAGMPAPYAGNGAAMRAGPLGPLYGRESRRLVEVVADQSRVTHQDPRCAAGAMAIAGAAAIAARGAPISAPEMLAELSAWVEPLDAGVSAALWDMLKWVHLEPEQAVAALFTGGLEPVPETEGWTGVSSFVTSSVCWSLYAFLRAPEDYWESVCIAIGVGGDTDTMAAMTGSITGARRGVAALPAELVESLVDGSERLAPTLTALARAVYAGLESPDS
jgi:ADP-ribosylglycohydrolase